MAEAVVPERATEPVSHVEELPRLEQQRAVHGGRFLLGYAVIVLMVGAAIAALAWMTRGDTAATARQQWSAWQPPEQGFQGIRQIAQEIPRQYRAANGEQLAAVTASPGEVQGLPLRYVAIRAGASAGLDAGNIRMIDPGETIVFAFCGLGGQRNCALPGQPSLERSLLLRREALELSLYAFKHDEDIQTVISLLPPPAENANLAVFLQRHMVADALAQPLARTLPARPPYHLGDIDAEARTINRYTELQFFRSGFELAPDQSVILNLEVPTATQ